MKKTIIILATALIPIMVMGQTGLSPDDYYKKGEDYYKDKDYSNALSCYMKAAEKDHVEAQNKIGVMYDTGRGVTKDYKEAAKWYRRAAEQGYARSQRNLGLMYKDGEGVEKNYHEALKWLQKAAEQNFAPAQNEIGVMYRNGTGVEKNYKEAAKWYKTAAENGDMNGQSNYAYLLKEGLGVKQSYTEALKWFRKAAEQGNDQAENWIGVMYERGDGVGQDYAEAMKWYLKAAMNNNNYAMYNIGCLYMKGLGVSQDYGLAESWLKKSLAVDPTYNNALRELASVQLKISEAKDISSMTNKEKQTSDDTYNQQSATTTIIITDVDKDIPLTTAKSPNLFAVVIGNEKYSKLPDVPYAENDAKMFREYCEKTLGVTKDHIKYLPNAGFVDIYDAVEWLKTGTDSYGGDASVIFYYAGHGLPDPRTGSQYLLPADVDGKNLNLTVSLQKLYDEFAQMPTRSVAVFLDACFSGVNRDNQMVTANKGARLAAVKSKPATPSGNTIVFSATEKDQTAHPFTDQKHGFFTYFLLRKLQESKGDTTFGEIADYVTKSVRRTVFDKIQVSQTPSVSASGIFSNDWRQMKFK